MADTKTKIGFGKRENFEGAIVDGKLNEYDLVCFDEHEIGWVDRDGNAVYAYAEKHAQMMTDAAADAEEKVATAKEEITSEYTTAIDAKVGDIGDSANVVAYVDKVVASGGSDVSGQIDQALADSKAYTDEQISYLMDNVVEF